MNTGFAKKAVWGVYGLTALLALAGWRLYSDLPSAARMSGGKSVSFDWNMARARDPGADKSGVFQYLGSEDGQSPSEGELPYRLAGTFLEYGDPDRNANRARKAIIDDLESGQQALLEEGDRYRDMLVERISKDHILLESGGVLHELWLSFGNGDGPEERSKDSASGEEPEAVADTSRFGRRVGDNRWVFRKQALRDFYREMLDDPARAVDIYETMRPDYGEDDAIDGYIVDVVGEQQFFDAVGLRNGDVVRKVNSMEMRSRQRAEYFIREFMKDRVNAVVLDIERDGQSRKQVYLLR